MLRVVEGQKSTATHTIDGVESVRVGSLRVNVHVICTNVPTHVLYCIVVGSVVTFLVFLLPANMTDVVKMEEN